MQQNVLFLSWCIGCLSFFVLLDNWPLFYGLAVNIGFLGAFSLFFSIHVYELAG